MPATDAPTDNDLAAVLARLARVLEDKPLAERGEPFTLAEIAARWGCTEKHIERLIARGELKAFKPARSWLVRPTALAKYERDLSGEGE